MKLIKHRCNSSGQLVGLHPDFGVEIDLRSSVGDPGHLHLSHDPWVQGENFDLWLGKYKEVGLSGPLILNTKEDGLESRTLELLKKHQIQNFFFLDTALPTLVKWSVKENKKFFAVRWSKFEPIEFCEKFKNHCEWVWIDCFFLEIPPTDIIKKLQENFKVCLVSPELQGGEGKTISEFRKSLPAIEAICTKSPELWS
ncbi:MAG: hypothetical protein AABY64_02260 [Bdellovibrionota bacterium]